MSLSCAAPAGTGPSDWLALAMSMQTSAPSKAASCFAAAAAADPLSHAPTLHLGLHTLAEARRAGSAKLATTHLRAASGQLRRAAQLALSESNETAAAFALRTLGDAASGDGLWEGAARAYERALALVPDDCVTSAQFANALWQRNDAAAAVRALRAALAEDHACPLAHHGLAQVLPSVGERAAALRHARAALELRPFDEDYENTLQKLLDAGAAKLPSAAGGEDDRAAAETSADAADAACGAPSTWSSPPAPDELAAAAGCTAARRRERSLLVNVFEEGCFHDDMRTNVRQAYHSCGQFNNVLASLVQALALSRVLCRTLVLPGFYIRFGRRLTRVSPFAERWLPTSHFLNLTLLQAAFDVVELPAWRAAYRLRFFTHHNLSFASLVPATFPHLLQQQSELRWVSPDAQREGYFSRFDAGYGANYWRAHYGAGTADAASTLVFDSPLSLGLQLDHLQWGESLRYARGHVRYRGAVYAEAARVRRSLFGRADAPFLAVHIRRGADRLHDFCHTGWGQRCFGWNITLGMCYPSTESVAKQILAAQEAWGVPHGHIFLATDSPRPELFEDVLRAHGVAFKRYGALIDGALAPALGEEFELPVDQVLCASAPYFLGNVPSTVTATIVQERDAMGWGRERTTFFGFDDETLGQFRHGWEASRDFAPHYADGGQPTPDHGCGAL